MKKKRDKRFKTKSERRILNRALDFFKRIRRGHMHHGWASAIAKSEVRTHDDEDE